MKVLIVSSLVLVFAACMVSAGVNRHRRDAETATVAGIDELGEDGAPAVPSEATAIQETQKAKRETDTETSSESTSASAGSEAVAERTKTDELPEIADEASSAPSSSDDIPKLKRETATEASTDSTSASAGSEAVADKATAEGTKTDELPKLDDGASPPLSGDAP